MSIPDNEPNVAGNPKPASPQPANAPDSFRINVGDKSSFSTSKIQPITHNLHEHPLMQMDRLAQLAKFLFPTGHCRFLKPGSTTASAFSHKERHPDGRDIDEVFRRMEEPGSWIALYDVDLDPAYNSLLHEALGTVRHLIDPQEPGTFIVKGYMFISAPPSVTPFHIDRENNFWLQIRGRKIINVWDATDREVVTSKDVENFVVSKTLGGVRLRDEFLARSHEFDVGPGEGVYFPSTSPHMTRSDVPWVRPGDGISISIGIVFYTAVTRRRANVHACNKALRWLGLQPRPPGISEWVDRLKYPLGRMVVILLRLFRRYSPPPGF